MTRARLPSTVLALGAVSFLADVSSEMIFPLLPLFLTQTLGAGPAFLGLVEGVADTVASLLKLASGYASDHARRRKPLVVLGYALAGVARPLVAVASAPWHVFAVRVTDRVGKGLRSAPRDALIADAAPPGEAGRAFGFHRAMDHAGAVVGPLVATALLGAGLPLRTVFWVAALPSALSILVVLLVRERPAAGAESTTPAEPRAPLPRSLSGYLAVLALFSLGNSSDAFLLLRARDLGVPDASIPLLWAVLHVAKVVSSHLGGALADRVPRTRLIICGWVVYAAVYLGLGVAAEAWQAWLLFVVYGAYYGLTEPAEKALVRDLAPPSARGRAFGFYNFIVGATSLPASLLTGGIWHAFGPRAALATGAGLAGAAALGLALWRRRSAPATT